MPKQNRAAYRNKLFDYLLGRVSGSQFGEDLSVFEYFLTMGKPVITYLDIGANHPKLHSNTHLLSRNGSSGVLVDANSEMCKKLRRARKRDKVINVGVAAVGGEDMDLSVMDIEGLSTLNPKWQEHLLSQGMSSEVAIQKVKIVGINDLLAEYFPRQAPDFVSIDIEGMDFEVLESWDFDRWRPSILCIETGILTRGEYIRDELFEKLMLQRGYAPLFQTFSNTLFLDTQTP
ncbi:FkbM family methyltransferase [Geopsychrobacter electrodiphilus]|uniref:FkbM family methyltransferase n=1 Tax=Geopsychrobacter electrodiphilus TaxID=225196 RepID=UPI00047747B8|nr:FkbM family methyltransferase [Geopsychrobacter electrodiphilus]